MAEQAIEIASSSDYDPYGIDTHLNEAVIVSQPGTKYYKRVIGETGPGNNAHATTQAYYTSNNASTQGTGYDTTYAELSTAWYGSGVPTSLQIEHKVAFYVEGASSKVQITISSTPSMQVEISNTKSSVTAITKSNVVSNTQVMKFYPPEATVTHGQLQGVHRLLRQL